MMKGFYDKNTGRLSLREIKPVSSYDPHPVRSFLKKCLEGIVIGGIILLILAILF